MRAQRLSSLLILLSLTLSGWLLPSLAHAAAEVWVTGVALIQGDDLQTARRLAYRDALAQAARQQRVRVTSQTSQINGEWLDNASLQTSAMIQQASIVREERFGHEMHVTVRAMVETPGEDSEQTCDNNFLRKLVIGAFPLEYPEQLGQKEFSHYAQTIPLVLRRLLTQRKHSLSEHAPTEFIYTSPARAPVLRTDASGSEFTVIPVARRYRAQYVLSGVIRDFGVTQESYAGFLGKRPLVIDAYLHDGMTGNLLNYQRFQTEIQGEVRVPPGIQMGSQAFQQTDVGAAFHAVLDKIAQWSEQQTSCAPFSARVIRVEGERIYLDVGAEARLAPGDSLVIFRIRQNSKITSLDNELLGYERNSLPSLSLREVQPMFSVARLNTPNTKIRIQVGDEVYAY